VVGGRVSTVGAAETPIDNTANDDVAGMPFALRVCAPLRGVQYITHDTWRLKYGTNEVADAELDQPSHVSSDRDGNVTSVWYKDGVRHRAEDMPAKLTMTPTGGMLRAEWWKHGECLKTIESVTGGTVIVNYLRRTVTASFGAVWGGQPQPPPPPSPVPHRQLDDDEGQPNGEITTPLPRYNPIVEAMLMDRPALPAALAVTATQPPRYPGEPTRQSQRWRQVSKRLEPYECY